jgi:hypothetical protein
MEAQRNEKEAVSRSKKSLQAKKKDALFYLLLVFLGPAALLDCRAWEAPRRSSSQSIDEKGPIE